MSNERGGGWGNVVKYSPFASAEAKEQVRAETQQICVETKAIEDNAESEKLIKRAEAQKIEAEARKENAVAEAIEVKNEAARLDNVERAILLEANAAAPLSIEDQRPNEQRQLEHESNDPE